MTRLPAKGGDHEAERRGLPTVAARPCETLAVVSHGIVLTLYLSALLGLPTPDPTLWRSIGLPDIAVVEPIARKVIVGFGQARLWDS